MPILHRHRQNLFFGVQVEVPSASVSVPLMGLTFSADDGELAG
jgi:hypothetical protein